MDNTRQSVCDPAAQTADELLRHAALLQDSAAAPPPAPVALDPELIGDFVLESRDHLIQIETQLLILERDAADSEALHAVFRGFHTIKGLAGFLELWDVQKLAHEVETVLDGARNGELTLMPDGIDVILESADYLQRWLLHLELTLRHEPSAPPPVNEALLERIRGVANLAMEIGPAMGVDLVTGMGSASEMSAPWRASGAGSEPSGNSASVLPEEEPARAGSATAKRGQTASIRVNTGKLDYLVDMAGEMVIAESMVRHDPELAGVRSPRFQRNIQQLTRITAELQKTAMAMRLVPVGPLFRRMERLVRDLSRQFGKSVAMETQGDEIEFDRGIVEELGDPLMHMVRNSLDHGIEDPEERQRNGKPAVARVLLKAQHQAGLVVIEIADDGRGLDRERIAAKAVEKGLIRTEEGLSDNDVYNLIFEPGFSTAAAVTNVSGRGVGMDVVRKHIEKLRGRIEIRSTRGQGASFFLKLPLTLAIIEGLVVGVGRERYILPLFNVREMIRPGEDTVWTVQHKGEMALVRGDLLPVTRLYRKFGVKPRSEDPRESVLVIADVEGKRFCLMVDELIGKQEVVIKSLGETLKDIPGIAGGAILGDGRVGLILDLERIA
jgi:two-component system, chemotaxis family, sensor kinase CheA